MTVTLEEERKVLTDNPMIRAKPYAAIECWAVVQDVVSRHFTRLQVGTRLRWHIRGLSHMPYAKLAYTSPIVHVDFALGLVETRNTIYRLGEASEEYESWVAATR